MKKTANVHNIGKASKCLGYSLRFPVKAEKKIKELVTAGKESMGTK